MGTRFSFKLAWRNIQSNKKVYLPYILSSIVTVAMFQMMFSLMGNDFVQERSSLLSQLFALGTVVIALFSVVFIFYTNSFLMKRRKKELGLYNVLGLEKKHVRKVLWLETLITGGFSILVGAFVGHLFGQLGFMFLNYLLRLPVSMNYEILWEASGVTALLFIGIFTLTLFYNMAQVTFSNPIKLLKGGNEGEKEPKSSPILFVIGLLTLGAGYVISLRINDPIGAITQFFLAVLLVIIGTYLIFTAGSIIILKVLKKNKAFYYQPGPFISVSGMIYRMKQHAVGLANISILSVMIIIAVSTTVTLFIGTEETIKQRFPAENNISVMSEYGLSATDFKENIDKLDERITAASQEQGHEIETSSLFRYISLIGGIENGTIQRQGFQLGTDTPAMVMILPLEDYNEVANETFTLGSSELYVYAKDTEPIGEQLKVGGQTFNANILNDVPELLKVGGLVDTLIIVVPDVATIDNIAASYNPDENPYMVYWEAGLHWETTATEDEKVGYAETMNKSLQNLGLDIGAFYESRAENRQEWYSMYGGFLFLGLFLGGLFTIGMALITYFKQVSEGYDDRERIQIMQKVGLDKETTRRATRSQILWMFVLPILIASVHTAFAYPIVQQMLMLFGIISQGLFISVTLGVLFIYATIYWLIYRITSKVYLRIVEN